MATLPYLWIASSEEDTERLGAALSAVLPPGAVVVLEGTLGAGKTRLVQAVAEAAGVDRRTVTSPTFTLIHEYARAAKTLAPDAGTSEAAAIYHFDAYRIRDEDEFRELGAEEYFASPGWSFVEWGNRVAKALPNDRLEIRIEPRGPTLRHFEFHPRGAPLTAAVAELARKLQG